MATGTVKWFNSMKRYGFITPDQGDSDVFVHMTALEQAGLLHLQEGQRVTYDLEDRGGRNCAINIQVQE